MRLKIYGVNFHTQCEVKIDGVVVPLTRWKNGALVVAKKGGSLKALLPKGVPVQITVENTDDGGVSAPYTFTR